MSTPQEKQSNIVQEKLLSHLSHKQVNILPRYKLKISHIKNNLGITSGAYLSFVRFLAHILEYNMLDLDIAEYGQDIIPPVNSNLFKLQISVNKLMLKHPFKQYDNKEVAKWIFNPRVNDIPSTYYMSTVKDIKLNGESVDEFLFEDNIFLNLLENDCPYIIGFNVVKSKPNDSMKFMCNHLSVIEFEPEKDYIMFNTLIDPQLIVHELKNARTKLIEQAIDVLKNIKIVETDSTLSKDKFNMIINASSGVKDSDKLYEKAKTRETIFINDETLFCMGMFLDKYSLFSFTKTVERNGPENFRTGITSVITNTNNTTMKERLNNIIKDLDKLLEIDIIHSHTVAKFEDQ
jgi:hypothetical protein